MLFPWRHACISHLLLHGVFFVSLCFSWFLYVSASIFFALSLCRCFCDRVAICLLLRGMFDAAYLIILASCISLYCSSPAVFISSICRFFSVRVACLVLLFSVALISYLALLGLPSRHLGILCRVVRLLMILESLLYYTPLLFSISPHICRR